MSILEALWTQTPVKLWLGLAAVGLALEFMAQPAQERSLRSVVFNLRNAAVYILAIYLLTPALSTAMNYVISLTGAGLIDLDVFDSQSIPQQLGAALVLILITDFFYYWLHRAQHAFPALWAQHVIHHSDEAVNVTTGTRHHWLEFVFQTLLIVLPMSIIFKLSAVNVWTISTLVAAYGWFIHMNIRVGLGSLSWLVCTPQLHRIHHSIEREHWDKNFAAYFPLWDVLFGTYYRPKPGEYPKTGVDGVRFSNEIETSVYPFKQWISMAAARAKRWFVAAG
ncbi:sterol desaturase family protein [Bosea sp. 2YAB26]|uniref:sterol desaturase family protein n=1 Tax=Bosea sp. 2YAB26 TaxID=3237478 RepID=UPI003F936712